MDEKKSHQHTNKHHWGQAFEVQPKPKVEITPQQVIEHPPHATSIKVTREIPVFVLPEKTTPEEAQRLIRMYKEGRAILALEEKGLRTWFKNLFSKKQELTDRGKVYTQENHELFVVENQRGEKFARYDIYNGTGDPSHRGFVRSVYIPYKKVEPILCK